MPKFSESSKKKLETTDERLQKLFNEVVKNFDCTILCGRRGEKEQNEAYEKGFSTLKFPQSKHNKTPSLAVDVAPYPINWKDKKRFYFFAGYVKGIAKSLNIDIRWGGDWDSDNDLNDMTFIDLPHFELK